MRPGIIFLSGPQADRLEQTEVEQLRKKLADVEMKSARQVHDVRDTIRSVDFRADPRCS